MRVIHSRPILNAAFRLVLCTCLPTLRLRLVLAVVAFLLAGLDRLEAHWWLLGVEQGCGKRGRLPIPWHQAGLNAGALGCPWGR